MSDKEFSGTAFALGTVRGYRSWKVTVEGKLSSVSQSAVWIPGENLAVCNGYPPREIVPPKALDEEWSDHSARVQAWKENHEMEECGHGYYAYFGEGDRWGNDPTVQGVIEAYGEVLIGTKGFRAMKARILAISVEPHEGIWNLDSFVVKKLRANYPGVPIFESTFAMQLEFRSDSGESEPVTVKEIAA